MYILLLLVLAFIFTFKSKEPFLNTYLQKHLTKCNSNPHTQYAKFLKQELPTFKDKTQQKKYCNEFAHKQCQQESYHVRNTKTHKFPIYVLPGKPPKTTSVKCWKSLYECCKNMY